MKMSWRKRLKSVFPELWKKHRILVIIIIISAVVLASVSTWGFLMTQQAKKPLTKYEKYFIEKVRPNTKDVVSLLVLQEKIMNGEIEEVYFQGMPKDPYGTRIYYLKIKGKEGFTIALAPPDFYIVAGIGKLSLPEYLTEMKVPVYPLSANPQAPGVVGQWWFSVMIILILIGGLGGTMFWFSRTQLGGKFRKNCAERFTGDKVFFDEVAGIDESKRELIEIKEFMENPEKFKLLGAKIPKGILLVGPPGCGKTTLAKAMATEVKAPFLGISGSEFIEMFVGVGASRIRDLFDQAKEEVKREKRCVIFIDEIDAIGGKRGADASGADKEHRQTLAQILAEMDGVASGSGIFILAATNREDILDPAFIRPGRFDRKIFVDFPNVSGREAILRVHTKNKPLAGDVELKELAQSIPLGSSGADLANIVNEAAIHAARHDKKQIDRKDFQDAKDKIMLGLVKEGEVITLEEKRMYAYHEAGHALVAKLLPNMPPLNKVSILRRGRTHGVVAILPEKDQNIKTKKELLDWITVALASVAAEEEIFGADGLTTGASDDLAQATKTATAMISVYGMSEEFGLVSIPALIESGFQSPSTKEIIEAVNKINSEARKKAQELIRVNRPKLDALAEALIELEDIDGKLAEKIIEEGRYPLN